MIDFLINITIESDLQLTLPREAITWEARNSVTTIDLIFMSTNLINKIEHCKIREKLNQSSDHKSISIKLLLKTEKTTETRRRV